MRVWHKEIVDVLPRQQLLGQWRECCAIASNIRSIGHPNHILVNRIMDYPLSHFISFTANVVDEMMRRGYKVQKEKFLKHFPEFNDFVYEGNMFPDWHNYRYLHQCIGNLQEKFDCGGISEIEWSKIANKFRFRLVYGGELS